MALSSYARDDLPEDISYIEANAKVNIEVKQMLVHAFGTKSFESVLGDAVICGPALWDNIKEHPALNGTKLTEASFHIPILSGADAGEFQVLKGSLFQTKKEIKMLSEILGALPRKTINVRKINANEASIYWALIPYDIEEPIYVVEHGDLRFLFDMTKSDKKVFWIDELSQYRKGEPLH
jgi:hypothetical protein